MINCTAFRRLQHKTQVFAPTYHDHFRNRLTHSLEVAQIARCLARHLCADSELSEAIALAHDLGHPPFSHAGEKALDELMVDHGGFNHNSHSLRVVEYLEHPYPEFRGLNLTQATLDGLRAHVTKFDVPSEPYATHGSLESDIVSVADRIAYDLHDLEDALGAGLIQDADLDRLRIWSEAAAGVRGNKPVHAVRRPVLDRVLNEILAGAIHEKSSGARVRLSQKSESAVSELEEFLVARVYRNAEVVQSDAEGRRMIRDLFEAYSNKPALMPSRFVQRIAEQGRHRVICDYIAGMTDSYCVAQHTAACAASRSSGKP